MTYRRYQRYSKPTPRNITVKYAGNCSCCGGRIEAGEWATYYPAGSVAGVHTGTLCHIGGVDGNSQKCYQVLKAKQDAPRNEDYQCSDLGYEDRCKEECGL